MMGVYMQRTLSDLQRPDEAQVQAVVLMVIAGVVGSFYILTMMRSAKR
jgi:hypothetical protein